MKSRFSEVSEMRICDTCFKIITDEGSYDITNGIRKDNCGQCLKALEKACKEHCHEAQTPIIAQEYERFFNKKEENINELISKLRKESRKYFAKMYVDE